ncbi:MAG: hypothetical protein N2327_00995 [Caldimicrobium sp.]|nr:hypothetical protein [Caldimicrobium sp.]
MENRELMRYLMWYNTERVHSDLGNESPLEWICNIWTYTFS